MTECPNCKRPVLPPGADVRYWAGPWPVCVCVPDTERAISSALRLRACVLKQRQLRQEINWSKCENDFDQKPPCPFNEEFNGVETAAIENPHEWCESCRKNYALRGELISERKRQAGLLRGFVNAAQIWEQEDDHA